MWHVLSNKPINIPSSVECDEGALLFCGDTSRDPVRACLCAVWMAMERTLQNSLGVFEPLWQPGHESVFHHVPAQCHCDTHS